jgi:hypothetical protein
MQRQNQQLSETGEQSNLQQSFSNIILSDMLRLPKEIHAVHNDWEKRLNAVSVTLSAARNRKGVVEVGVCISQSLFNKYADNSQRLLGQKC